MSLFLWLRSRATTHAPQGRGKRRPAAERFRPQLEALDERWLPSTLTVTNNLGFGAGSLRGEIGIAQSGDTIVFDPSLRGQTINLNTNAPGFGGPDELVINKNLDIEGPGASNLAINGGYLSRVFRVTAEVQVTLSGLMIENGNGTTGAYDPAPDDGKGGGILNYGTLTVNGCQVSGDSVNTNAVYGGGIYNAGMLTVSGSTVTHNIALYAGGGIFNATRTLTILNSTVIDNTCIDGADVFSEYHFTMQNSTIGKIKRY
jgi:hypothetical protein